MSVAVLGSGSWGVALAKAFSYVMPTTLWGRNVAFIEQLKANCANVDLVQGGLCLPSKVVITNDFSKIVGCNLLVIATSTNGLRDVLVKIKQLYTSQLPDIIWVCKGLESGSGLLPHQVVMQVCGKISNVGALLGPSFAKEVLLGLPTAITLTSDNLAFATKWINLFKGIPNFRVYANTDVVGSEVGAALKNVMAIATGISDGLKLGYNARAALITRSLNELGLLVLAMGGRSETIYGLTGVGDLILTCTGDLSRNRTVGLKLAEGMAIEDILVSIGHVAEGVNTVVEIKELSEKLDIDMPIVTAVYNIIYNKANVLEVVKTLINREPKLEFNN